MGQILIVGDLFPIEYNLERFSNGDVEGLFDEKIRELFSKADYRICNLEGALTDSLERCEKTGPVITAPTNALELYKKLGIDCCMLANNHITDAGHQGVIDTMSILDQANISHIGAGENVDSIVHHSIIQIDKKSIGLYNVCETMYNQPTKTQAGAYIYDEYIVCKELESLKQKCDYLIVIYHGGIEKYRYPSPEMRKRFQRMADNGADIILSQHTHCIGCEEYYNGSYFLYGQGDFMLKNFRPEITDKGYIVLLDINQNGISIQKQMVRCSKDFRLQYIENPDFSDFLARSEKLKDVNFLHEQLQQFCEGELRLYLNAFKSPGKMYRIIRRFSPKLYNKWLYTKAFSRRNLMFILHTLRSEQNRETAIVGIEGLLDRV